jgi:hypothetical protein
MTGHLSRTRTGYVQRLDWTDTPFFRRVSCPVGHPVDESGLEPEPVNFDSYDDRQRLATLKACRVSGHSYYFVRHATEVCASCR